jgi:hypothetical protein
VEFFVISVFHETKIRTVDLKVQVYSNFRKNKISKKVNSPNSMRNGRFSTSKCRGKLEKMGVLCTHSTKSPGPISKLSIKNLKKIKKIPKKRDQADPVQGRPATSGRPPAAGRHLDRVGLPLFFEFFFCTVLHFWSKWSTLAGWFQHKPALPRVHLKTSNTQNF